MVKQNLIIARGAEVKLQLSLSFVVTVEPKSSLNDSMFCTSCGKEIEGNNKFCTECGAVVKSGTPADDHRDSAPKHRYSKKKFKIIVGVVAGAIILAILLSLVYWTQANKKETVREQQSAELLENTRSVVNVLCDNEG